MQDSRDHVLERIRERLGRSPSNAAAALTEVQAELARRRRGPAAPTDGDLIERFVANSQALSSTVERVAALAEAPLAIARYLEAHGLPRRGCAWPLLGGLDFAGAGLAIDARAARDDDLVGITGVFCAIAETGTLMLLSGRDTPAATSLLPETHVALVPASRVVARMDDGWALMRKAHGRVPRAVNFVSGPSRTGDIEQTIVLGAHGPYRVHILLIANA